MANTKIQINGGNSLTESTYNEKKSGLFWSNYYSHSLNLPAEKQQVEKRSTRISVRASSKKRKH